MPILWAPGKIALFLPENHHAHKIPHFRGAGGILGFGKGGGEVPILFYVRADLRAGDEDSNFSVFRVRRFSERPEPLH